jgi:hypothetical protein
MGLGDRFIFPMAMMAVFLTAVQAGPLTNGASMTLQITTTSFTPGQPIPDRYAYEHGDVSPALQWSGVPSAAKSLALICEDPDAPMGTYTHWVIYDLPPASSGLAEGVAKSPEVLNGAKQGMNDYKKIGYGGPCPPPGKPHRYFFKLYALDAKPDLKPGISKKELLKAMKGRILAEAELMGTYQAK